MLVLVCGLPGTGKSVTANQIARDIDATILRTDAIRKENFKQGVLEEVLKSPNPFQFDLESIFDRQKVIPEKFQRLIWRQKEYVYDKLLEQITKILQRDLNLVLDATAYSKESREEIYEISRKTNTKIFLIECICSEDILKKRFERRSKKPHELSYVDKMEVYLTLKSRFEDPLKDGKPVVIYDTGSQKIESHNVSEEDKEFVNKLKRSLEKVRLRYG